jgi:diguanylate cyclase (GGDEF)-like protein
VLCRGVAVFDAEGRAIRAAGSQTDITLRKRAEEELRRNALHDALTGLPNRALLVDRLELALAATRRKPDRRFAVLFLDLDRFKNINDSLGHLAGDQLLVQLAGRLRGCARATDTVARFGGDEFAIIASDIVDESGATLVAQRIQDALRVPFTIGEHVVVVSTSIGIAISAQSYERAEDLVRDADNAMYRAKVQGRARHEVFNTPMHEEAMARLKLEEELHRALARGEFRLHYQPFVCLRRGQVIGVEALIRWQHPKQGLLAPAAFLSVVEESGLMLPMNECVLRTACADLKGWRREGIDSIYVSVNLPSQQLGDTRFVDFVTTTLREADLPPEALGLELVESSLIENKEDTIKLLQGLRDRGIRIAIDDFGTGYSSLSYLKRFPLDTLKIDRSFTQGIPKDPSDTGISTAIIAMAHSLGLTVIAEGVETQDQLEFYGARGCDMVQGYLLSPPLPAAECGRFLHAQRTKTRPFALAI